MKSIPEPFYKGKVRDLYPVDDSSMILAATDRLSAFDVVFGQPVPGKGKILTGISNLWFESLQNSGLMQKLDFGSHIIETDVDRFPDPYRGREEFRGRAVHVRRCNRVDFECVVRGYLAGSGWKDYQKTGEVSGHALPSGLRQADILPEPIFTPATKAPLGEHDENVTFASMKKSLGEKLAGRLETISIEIYKYAAAKMEKSGILLCDTKFEFGQLDGKLVLIDEVLTPDSSRYWDAASYAPGQSPPGYDKQYVRDYVESIHWNKSPPAPVLPDEVINKTVDLYSIIFNKIKQTLA